jgi:hypothetical protein
MILQHSLSPPCNEVFCSTTIIMTMMVVVLLQSLSQQAAHGPLNFAIWRVPVGCARGVYVECFLPGRL